MNYSSIPGFRKVPKTGVIYVMQRATEMGYKQDDANWSNLGQGAPETSALEGAPPRIDTVNIHLTRHEYAPVTGQKEVCQAVADLYNTLYRQGKKSQYTWENVSISGGGRVGLARIVAGLGNINMGHFLPDYTAYEELLSIFKAFVPIPILLDPGTNYQISIEQLQKEIMGRGLKTLLVSNPCNPTGQVIKDEKLQACVKLARDLDCSFIFDEFYSHYIYQDANTVKTVSAAEFVDDVNKDPIVILDGLTKNWRYPGWRISWTLGPKEVIQTIASAGSFLDGGATNPLQSSILDLLQPSYVNQEARILQDVFRKKRDYTVARLKQMGIIVEVVPEATFYVWANLSSLPASIRDGVSFLEAGLKEKVITVPGIFFDVNPEKRRAHGQYSQYCRISFGPQMQILEQGLNALERVISQHS